MTPKSFADNFDFLVRFAPNHISKCWNFSEDRNHFFVWFLIFGVFFFLLLPNQLVGRTCDEKRSHPCFGAGSEHGSGWVTIIQVHQEGKAMAMFPSSHQQGVQAVSDVMENVGADFSGSSRVKHE